jgi:hypothetical protein
MRPECIPKPTKEQWELTALEFERRANFSLGAVDGETRLSNQTGTQRLDVP